jgi:hypothetical protein
MRVANKDMWVADNDKEAASTSDCHIETLGIVQKTNVMLDVEAREVKRAAHHRNDDNLALLSLEHLGGTHFDITQIVLFEEAHDFVHLLVVGRYEAYKGGAGGARKEVWRKEGCRGLSVEAEGFASLYRALHRRAR